MIAGQIVAEDTTVQFFVNFETNEVEVRLSDNCTGQLHQTVMTQQQFAASVALMLDPNGGDHDPFSTLRQLADDGHEGVPDACRMIP